MVMMMLQHSCPHCDREFLKKCGLSSHIKAHVRKREAPMKAKKRQKGSCTDHTATPTDDNKLKCQVCGKQCLKRNGLSNHMNAHVRKGEAPPPADAQELEIKK